LPQYLARWRNHLSQLANEKVDLVTDLPQYLARWRNHLSQLANEKVDLVTDLPQYLARWRNHLSQLANEKVDLVTDCHGIWLGGGTIYLSWPTYIGLVMLGRERYTQ